MNTRKVSPPRRYLTFKPQVFPAYFRVMAYDLIDGTEMEIDVSVEGLRSQILARETAELFAPAVVTTVLTDDNFCWYNSSSDYPNSNKLYWP